jgi:hypothetical protein
MNNEDELRENDRLMLNKEKSEIEKQLEQARKEYDAYKEMLDEA